MIERNIPKNHINKFLPINEQLLDEYNKKRIIARLIIGKIEVTQEIINKLI